MHDFLEHRMKSQYLLVERAGREYLSIIQGHDGCFSHKVTLKLSLPALESRSVRVLIA